MKTFRPPRGFTLVELLVVIAIISVLSGMVMTAVQGVTQTAKSARTRAIIAAVDSIIQEQYESYKYRPLPVEINATDYEVLATEAARVRLMMIRDLQRMEMPDRMTDIFFPPMEIRAAAFPLFDAGVLRTTRADKTDREMFSVSGYDTTAVHISPPALPVTNANIPSKLAAYRARLRAAQDLAASDPAINDPLDITTNPNILNNQGAECLYLILSTSFVAGTPAITAIADSNIGDTDRDGMLEILDGWGNPLSFIRWPVGYDDPEQTINTISAPDDFDLFRSDYAYIESASTAAVPTYVRPDLDPDVMASPWSMRPLILSTGIDAELGIATNPWTGLTTGDELKDFVYSDPTWNWPVNAGFFGNGTEGELGGRDQGPPSLTFTDHPFPDPYLRIFVATYSATPGVFDGLLPGQFLADVRNPETADNITNYSLQAAQ